MSGVSEKIDIAIARFYVNKTQGKPTGDEMTKMNFVPRLLLGLGFLGLICCSDSRAANEPDIITIEITKEDAREECPDKMRVKFCECITHTIMEHASDTPYMSNAIARAKRTLIEQEKESANITNQTDEKALIKLAILFELGWAASDYCILQEDTG